MPKGFHAITSAVCKRYAYYLAVPTDADAADGGGGDDAPAWARAVWRRRGPLDVRAMARAARGLVGARDFRHLTSDRHKADTKRTLAAARLDPLLNNASCLCTVILCCSSSAVHPAATFLGGADGLAA